ncbi:MAG: phosphoglycerate mutase [Rhodobacteraceae bacterium]|nr:phosphoglycerate mutase [Paracoccaceae bacterium]MAY44280.1 phosphoglycerate mutase [Paracoccaceae bacterium]QEW22105.1 phosphohistidine phosphatase [Marinibacterium anthonyi]
MTCTLILMRHAKSSWSDPGQPDHLRPLNKRGKRAARALGDWLRGHGHIPDQILCSSAARAQLTCQGLELGLPAPAVPALYHAEPGAMLQVLQKATGRCVLMIGHNPGIADFARQIVAQAPRNDRFADYPTGATLVATFDVPGWGQATWKSGTAVDFIVPRALTD